MTDELRKGVVVNVIADAMPANPESSALDPDGALARNNARDIIAALDAAGWKVVPKTPEYQSRYVTLKLTYYKEDVPKVHIQSVAGLEGLLLGGSYSNLVVWNDLGPAIKHLLQANHDWPVKESTDDE